MRGYGRAERKVAELMDGFPRLRQGARAVYRRCNYWLSRERGFTLAVHPEAEPLRLPAEHGETCRFPELFFGYYDKSPWAPDMAHMVFHSPRTDGLLDIVVLDLKSGAVCRLEASSAWNHQQGGMAQWLPRAGGQWVVYNDYAEGRLVSRVVSLSSGSTSLLPWPVQAIHPRGGEALTLNYRRLHRLRPAYGYSHAASNFSATQPLEEDGIWLVNLETGKGGLIVTLDMLRRLQPRAEMRGADHKVNHLMYSPQGRRFVFLHRWVGPSGKFSRLYTAEADGSHLRLLLDERMVSHYCWRDEDHLVVWARTKEAGDRYYLLNVLTAEREIIGAGILDVCGDGHPSFSPDRRWMVTDTYPDRARQQHLLLYEVATGRRIELGRFLAPLPFDGPKRCDLHPRWSPDGRQLSIDSAHEGRRMTYTLDVSSLVDGPTVRRVYDDS